MGLEELLVPPNTCKEPYARNDHDAAPGYGQRAEEELLSQPKRRIVIETVDKTSRRGFSPCPLDMDWMWTPVSDWRDFPFAFSHRLCRMKPDTPVHLGERALGR